MAELLEKSLYVDDLLTGDDNDDKGLVIYKKTKQIKAEGGFNLRKWNSNSRSLLRAEHDESYAKSSTTPGRSEAKNETIVRRIFL